jgi:hypothetical protein
VLLFSRERPQGRPSAAGGAPGVLEPGRADCRPRAPRLEMGYGWIGHKPGSGFWFFGPSSFNTALQLVLRPHFLVHFV